MENTLLKKSNINFNKKCYQFILIDKTCFEKLQ